MVTPSCICSAASLQCRRADLVFALDDSRTTLVLSLLVRGKRKTGWVQGISRLYAEGGFFEWKSVRPWLSAMVKAVYRPGRIRLPEDKHDGEVELELLDLQGQGRPLASYRSDYASPPRPAAGSTLHLLRGRSRLARQAAYR